MGTRGNITIESPHTHVTNLPSVSCKVVGNKICKLSGDMAFAFKLTESSKKLKLWNLNCKRRQLKLQSPLPNLWLRWKKSIGKKVENKLYNRHNFFQLNSKLDILLMFKKIDKRFASILCMNTIFIQNAIVVWNMSFIYWMMCFT